MRSRRLAPVLAASVLPVCLRSWKVSPGASDRPHRLAPLHQLAELAAPDRGTVRTSEDEGIGLRPAAASRRLRTAGRTKPGSDTVPSTGARFGWPTTRPTQRCSVKTLPDANHIGLGIDALTLQRRHLAPAQATERRHQHERAITLGNALDELEDLGGRENRTLGRLSWSAEPRSTLCRRDVARWKVSCDARSRRGVSCPNRPCVQEG